MLNRIVTRGMGLSRGAAGRAGLVTQGYAGFFQQVVEVSRRIIRVGKSGAKYTYSALEEIIVGARLVAINDKKPDVKVQGWIRITFDRGRSVVVRVTRETYDAVKSFLKEIVIRVKRIK